MGGERKWEEREWKREIVRGERTRMIEMYDDWECKREKMGWKGMKERESEMRKENER